MTIGVLGGTFNPIHWGHLILAQEIAIRLNFAKILFVPAKIPPLKTLMVSEQHRFTMVQLAIEDNPLFEISRVEFDRPEISYTMHTIELLVKQLSEPFAFIIGSDNVADLPNWHNWQQLVTTCDLVIGERPQFGIEVLEKLSPFLSKKDCDKLRNNFVHIPMLKISSSEIRKRYAKKISNRYLVPCKVNTYILENDLYQNECDSN